MLLYVDVIVPVPLHGLFTYSVPTEIENEIHVGSRVIVQFGSKKFYTAIVYRLYKAGKKAEEIKELTTVLEDYPIVSSLQLRFWDWISSYYMCTMGDVFRAALPSALKIESETFITRHADYEGEEDLSSNEISIFNQLSPSRPLKLAELEKLTGITNVVPPVKALVDKGAAILRETLSEDYRAKTELAVRLVSNFSEEEIIKQIDNLARAPKQQELLIAFLQEKDKPIFRKQLLEKANTTASILNELIKKEILSSYEVEVDRLHYGDTDLEAAHTLNDYQQRAYKEIYTSFEKYNTSLLHGVTGSGKTEIYIQLIKDAIEKGEQVLYLVPEIALTTQITDRLKNVFGNKLAVFHSRFNDKERAETWNKLLTGSECQIVLGARSAIFLPFTKLGLIIVDEEHETSYKQQDPAPRYNARNAAIVLASMFGAKTLLGTATPAIETYYNALTNRFGLVNLTQRHADMALPKIEIVNTKELRRKKQMKSFLSPSLTSHIHQALEQEKQVILFQNRRGFAPLIECKICSWTPLCEHCDVSLTYHKGIEMIICHYCGASYRVPTECPNCEAQTLDTRGYGTERIEEEVSATFDKAKVVRMDLDTTRGKKSYEKIISDFEIGNTNILVGTQMVSKGLDFEKVNIVGILNADNQLNYSDFRAHEKAYQMLTQVSGRAGRKGEQGTVILQTSQPNHPIIQFVKQNDYLSFYDLQIDERRLFRYPPFYRLIEITLRARDERSLDAAASSLGNILRQSFGERVLGPTRPPISRIQRLYIRKIVLKIENNASVEDVRNNLIYCQKYIANITDFKSVLVHYDVDPM